MLPDQVEKRRRQMEAAERARRAAAEAQRALDVFRQQNNLDGGQPPAASASPDPHGGERGFGLLRQLFAQCPSPGKGGPCCMLAAPGAAPASSPDLGIMGRGLACTSAYFWITEDEHGRRGVHKRATVGMLKSCRTTPHINCPLRTCLGTPVKYAKSQDKAKMPLPPMQVRAGKLVPRPARALGRRCSWNTPTRPAQQPPRSCGSSSAMRPSGACSGCTKGFWTQSNASIIRGALAAQSYHAYDAGVDFASLCGSPLLLQGEAHAACAGTWHAHVAAQCWGMQPMAMPMVTSHFSNI